MFHTSPKTTTRQRVVHRAVRSQQAQRFPQHQSLVVTMNPQDNTHRVTSPSIQKEPNISITPDRPISTNETSSDNYTATHQSTNSATPPKSKQSPPQPMFKLGNKSKVRVSADEVHPTQQIGPDGLTVACNRSKTFDTFVAGEKLADAPAEQKKMGHTSQLKRGLAKLFRKSKR
ncbi:hypothetical protein P280DRAFT_470784 [Massarina eburnea CBS 473.64]|uniref:Uncharacterized protein n=1 Tax=Massarina eburnea CBS 473.64 TaxID=1395130 RepID=A0A6A6RVP6_9PLEO|nr:hypothetical protein P280DRAFT_470784 [Massarina eburnea CBS 473.64]